MTLFCCSVVRFWPLGALSSWLCALLTGPHHRGVSVCECERLVASWHYNMLPSRLVQPPNQPFPQGALVLWMEMGLETTVQGEPVVLGRGCSQALSATEQGGVGVPQPTQVHRSTHLSRHGLCALKEPWKESTQ